MRGRCVLGAALGGDLVHAIEEDHDVWALPLLQDLKEVDEALMRRPADVGEVLGMHSGEHGKLRRYRRIIPRTEPKHGRPAEEVHLSGAGLVLVQGAALQVWTADLEIGLVTGIASP